MTGDPPYAGPSGVVAIPQDEWSAAWSRFEELVPCKVPSGVSQPFIYFLTDDPARQALDEEAVMSLYIDVMSTPRPYEELLAISPRLALYLGSWWIGARIKLMSWLLIAITDQRAHDGEVFPRVWR